MKKTLTRLLQSPAKLLRSPLSRQSRVSRVHIATGMTNPSASWTLTLYLSGNVYEKRLIEKYIDEHGKEPGSDTDLDKEDLLPIQTSRVVRPRPAALTSIPALLSTFQNEWDSLALETYNLQQQLQRTREELANALYQHDAAIRVIARLTKERNEARDALAKVTVSAPAPAAANAGDSAMAIDSELPQDVAEHVDETAQMSVVPRKIPAHLGAALVCSLLTRYRCFPGCQSHERSARRPQHGPRRRIFLRWKK